MPDIRQMARRTARRKEDHVDPHVVAGFSEVVEEHFGGGRDAGQTAFVYSEVEVCGGGAGLYLDKGEHRTAPCDKVHLSGWRAQAAADNLPALEPQPPCGDAFGLPPAFFGLLALHPFSSSARS